MGAVLMRNMALPSYASVLTPTSSLTTQMPILSTTKHALPFTADPAEAQHLADIETLMRDLQRIKVNPRVQKMMLDRAVWLVVELTGNFYSRYRSEGTTSKVGVRIQRDHIYTRRSLVAELLAGTQNIRSVIDRAKCCVVTKEEHDRLTKVPQTVIGLDRYRLAVPIVKVRNMETGAWLV